MAFQLSDFLPNPTMAPELAQRQVDRERTSLLANQALETGTGRFLLQSRTIPDYLGSQAGRGNFFSGASIRGVRRATEDQAINEARIQQQTNQSMVDFLNRQFVATTGVQL